MLTVVSAMTWLPRPSTTPSPSVRIGSGPRSRSGIIPAVRVTCSPMMQCPPSWIHGSPKTVPWGKASRVPSPIAPKRSRPGCSAVTAPASRAHAQPRWTTQEAARRRRRVRKENVFRFFGTGSR